MLYNKMDTSTFVKFKKKMKFNICEKGVIFMDEKQTHCLRKDALKIRSPCTRRDENRRTRSRLKFSFIIFAYNGPACMTLYTCIEDIICNII